MEIPPDLAEMVIVHAWRTFTPDTKAIRDRDAAQRASDGKLRWSFFGRLSQVSRTFKYLVQAAACHTVTIETQVDFDMHQKIIFDVLGPDPATDPARGFLQNTELFITLTDVDPFSGFGYRVKYEQIPDFITACRVLTVAIESHSSTYRSSAYRACEYQTAFDCLARYGGACAEVHFAWTYTHNATRLLPATISAPDAPPVRQRFPGVQRLRLTKYPRCKCHHWVRGHVQDCFSHLLPTIFPNLVHLHIETPYFLKNITLPPRTRVLELEVPPCDGPGSYSLVPWNFVSGLKAGLMQCETRQEGGDWR
ncbi:uncharacterized protein BXZ73DRAFT_103281 [Epithele typhae]|uniref:uncharacterized protein n=1 Tax=Epithele typhae TaxID=378194 RepID=UPI002008D9BD|nr:uncharacterized protein BXZ73DRAFT_103281 [Epithele typhae]KAH9925399.1 hypothetical protein BXZ73DRAFT_103281 [Epithele typhae]